MDDVAPVQVRSLSEKQALERIIKFGQRFGSMHTDLALHAAFPLVLSPDQLYRLWATFLPHIPWTTVSDVLLSPLCQEVGYELYEMDPAIRNILLRELREDNRFGDTRLRELAGFMDEYIRLNLDSNDPDQRNLAEAQRVTALAHIAPDQAAREVAAKFSDPSRQLAGHDLLRVATLMESLSQQLRNYSPLVDYARGVERLAHGDRKTAAALLDRVFEGKPNVEIAGVTLQRPTRAQDVRQTEVEEETPITPETRFPPAPKIYISYRRADSEGYAGRLYDRLSAYFGRRNLFMDVVAIDAGVDFAQELEQAVQACDVLLALIGPQWLTIKDAQGKPRLENPGDYVRLEIATALKRGVRVIPVLLQGTSMPVAAALPDDLKPLAMRIAIEISTSGFDSDMERLIQQIERALDEAERDKPWREQVASSAFRSLHQLPQPPADFTGREELIDQLLADLQKRKGAAITGMGGSGKTALGLVVAHRIADDYPDAQIFLDLKGTTTPLSTADVMRHVILSFEPTADLRALDEAGMSNAYRSVLYGKRALLLFDNARSAEQIAPLRPPETCTMLVTSRWIFNVPGLRIRHLDLMSPENAESFLLELCPRVGDQADELARACAYLPLALRIAGSFLQVNSDWPVKRYVAQLEDHKGRLAALAQSRQEAELTTEPDLLTTFAMSYIQLSEDDQKRWRILGVFPASFDAQAAAAMWQMEEGEARKLLALLLRYRLIDYDQNSSRYSLPDLLADYALSQMGAGEEAEARLKHAFHYEYVLRSADDLYFKGGENVLTSLRLFDQEWVNIWTGQAWAAARGKDPAALRLLISYMEAGTNLLTLRLHTKERIQWGEEALSAAGELGDPRGQGQALGNLGIAYHSLGDLRKAIEYCEQSLLIARKIGDRRDEGNALRNLGNAYYESGDLRKAIEYYEQALAIAREIGNRQSEGSARGNLGLIYKDLGDIRRAIEYYEQSLVIKREIGDRLGEGHSLGNLGVAYKDLGEIHKAIEYYEQSLAIAREIGDREGEGAALGNLGVAYKDSGEIHKAIEYYEQSLAIKREIGDRLGEGRTFGNLGNAYAELGEIRKAIEYYEQRLAIAREIGDRRGEGRTFGNLGNAYAELGEPRKAKECYEEQLTIVQEMGDRQGEGSALGNLGSVLQALGDLAGARAAYERALKIDEAAFGPDHPNVAIRVNNLGGVLQDLGDLAGARAAYERALRIDEAAFGPDHPNVARDVNNLGGVLQDLGDLAGALAAFERALKILKQFLPGGHPNMEIVQRNLDRLSADAGGDTARGEPGR